MLNVCTFQHFLNWFLFLALVSRLVYMTRFNHLTLDWQAIFVPWAKTSIFNANVESAILWLQVGNNQTLLIAGCLVETEPTKKVKQNSGENGMQAIQIYSVVRETVGYDY